MSIQAETAIIFIAVLLIFCINSNKFFDLKLMRESKYLII